MTFAYVVLTIRGTPPVPHVLAVFRDPDRARHSALTHSATKKTVVVVERVKIL